MFSGNRSRQKSCHSGKNQKTCPHENWGDEYFLIFTRNPLFSLFRRNFDLLIMGFFFTWYAAISVTLIFLWITGGCKKLHTA
jgi:hypothetical protein